MTFPATPPPPPVPVIEAPVPAGHPGIYDFGTRTIIVRPSLSAQKRASVVAHETGHALQHQQHGSLAGVLAALGPRGAEHQADCVGELIVGPSYIPSTAGCTPQWRPSALALISSTASPRPSAGGPTRPPTAGATTFATARGSYLRVVS